MAELRGKVAIITGAATGIGRATARLFAKEGARLVLADSNTRAGSALARQLGAAGSKACFVETDVADPEQCRRMVGEALTRYGRLDIAFNNAGIADGATDSSAAYAPERWRKVIDVNLSGVFYCLQSEVEAMLESKRGGAVVNSASIAGKISFAKSPAYTASKHGVVGITKVFANEYGGRGIRTNAIGPGFVETPMTGGLLASARFREAVIAATPSGRIGTPGEIGQAVLWLCSQRASYVNGAFLAIDGGYLVR